MISFIKLLVLHHKLDDFKHNIKPKLFAHCNREVNNVNIFIVTRLLTPHFTYNCSLMAFKRPSKCFSILHVINILPSLCDLKVSL